jgi:hypothetical protein
MFVLSDKDRHPKGPRPLGLGAKPRARPALRSRPMPLQRSEHMPSMSLYPVFDMRMFRQ